MKNYQGNTRMAWAILLEYMYFRILELNNQLVTIDIVVYSIDIHPPVRHYYPDTFKLFKDIRISYEYFSN